MKKYIMENKLLNETGITLVALIITIIVLLILTGVSVNILFGLNGLAFKSKEEVDMYNTAAKGESEAANNFLNSFETETEGEKSIKLYETTSIDFVRLYGVIDIIWLDMNNNVISEPLSPAPYLGGMQPIKWDGITEVSAGTASNPDADWYSYIAQPGITDGKTSKWANAKTSNGNCYFVWIPRYAYKITYFDSVENQEAYGENRESTEGIIGYSTIDGMIDVTSGTPRLVTGTEPTNVTGTVKTAGYTEYIPHPGFEFDGAKAGIWVGKYETGYNGATSASNAEKNEASPQKAIIKPSVYSWRSISVSNIFATCAGIANYNNITADSHMIKNIEWGAVAYLTISKYGRNGYSTNPNNHSGSKTGFGGALVPWGGGGSNVEKEVTDTGATGWTGTYPYNNTYTGVLASTTGNTYGIYDMHGGAGEYVAAYIYKDSNSAIVTNGYNTNLLNADAKYKDVYTISSSDTHEYNYGINIGIRGDAIYETSETGSPYMIGVSGYGWHDSITCFPAQDSPVFYRGSYYDSAYKTRYLFFF